MQRIHRVSLLLLCALLSVEAFSLVGTPPPFANIEQHRQRSCSERVGNVAGNRLAGLSPLKRNGQRRLSTSMSSSTASEAAASSAAAVPKVLPDRGLHKTELGHVHYYDWKAPDSSSLPVVCLHMMPTAATEFSKAAPILSATHGRRVIAIDLLGYGASDIPCRSCTMLEVADAVVSVLDSLGIERFTLAGSLTGSKVAVAITSKYPERVGALAVTHIYEKPPPSGEARIEDEKLNTIFNERWELLESGEHLNKIWNIRLGLMSHEDNQRKTAENLVAKMNQNDMKDRGIVMQPAHQLPLKGLVEKITCPVLCITGSEAAALYNRLGLGGDNLAYAVSQMPVGKEVLTIEGATTFVLATHPLEWANAVEDFSSRAEAA
mmetsp:Transcript_12318/g.30176  ORF Transcript_12318/g.30176 Transcript_12318/m.30176 type:complete len:378 (+) Transcript_12318:179-1312(+)